ncbi:Trk family potassium uptake protein [Dehalococcoidia bacterium]|nr:Trk family potassium uptake protein [Dehalococcoidia bacterium]
MEEAWRRILGDRAITNPLEQELEPVHLSAPPPRPQGRKSESPLILVYGFGSLIALGTLLLWLPYFNATGDFAPFLVALFTATSAGTVTGLVTVDTATFWNPAGQVIIMALIFVGGLGFMSTATFLLVVITQRIRVTNQLFMQEFLGVNQLGGWGRITVQVISISVIVQLVGFVLFFWRFLPVLDPGQAAWQASFLAVSAFNNAGFNIFPGSESLAIFREEMWILGVAGILIVLGGVSYSVLVDFVRFRRFRRFTLDSRLVLITSLALWLFGGLVIFVSEFANESTLKGLSFTDQLLNSFFMSVSGRTAGFTTLNFSETQQHTNVFVTALMFIGGASGSVAGGIKVNTLAVILLAVIASVRGRNQVEAFGREIPTAQVQRALTIAFLGVSFVSVISFLLVVTERFPFDQLIFEAVSAFGTGGLSTGITPYLSAWGKTIIVVTMFVGRIGPLTIALALGQRQQRAIYRYSQERVRIG